MTQRKVRFMYKGTWTQWFDPDAVPVEIVVGDAIEIEAMEMVDLMPRNEALAYLKSLNEIT